MGRSQRTRRRAVLGASSALIALAALAALAASAAFAGAGCGSFASSDAPAEPSTEAGDAASESTPPDASAPDTSTDDGGGPSACPTGRGPVMVEIAASGKTAAFCIDATEVTQAQYQAFLDSTPAPSHADQPPECLGAVDAGFATDNTSFTPKCAEYYDPVLRPAFPVACVDWCDAVAYCKWAGKRLCMPSRPDIAESMVADGEWFAACSRGGTRDYPYGSSADAGGCSFHGLEAGATPVPTTTCQGGYDGLYDMVGNVSEWLGYCAPSGYCRVGGNDYGATPPDPRCDFPHGVPRNASARTVGIRCCADANP
jgi:sulfatase modifying factor 1